MSPGSLRLVQKYTRFVCGLLYSYTTLYTTRGPRRVRAGLARRVGLGVPGRARCYTTSVFALRRSSIRASGCDVTQSTVTACGAAGRGLEAQLSERGRSRAGVVYGVRAQAGRTAEPYCLLKA